MTVSFRESNSFYPEQSKYGGKSEIVELLPCAAGNGKDIVFQSPCQFLVGRDFVEDYFQHDFLKKLHVHKNDGHKFCVQEFC